MSIAWVAPPAAITDGAAWLLKKRYLNNGETADGMFRRVANGNEKWFKIMRELRFLPNSPTLFNAGLNNGCTLSACFVFDVADSMFGPRSIVETRAKAIAVAKAGGGVGYYLGDLRPRGSPIKSIQRVACGPVGVLKDYHGVASLITQGGKRELAQMGVLPCWHKDVRDFIHVKDRDPQGLGSFNISVSWTDEWVRKVKANSSGPEAALWKEQCESAWKTGCPGMFFYDRVNRGLPNPHLGLIRSPNPCGEVPNRCDEPCNLGSLSLPRYWNGLRGRRGLDLTRLAEDAETCLEFLDDVLDRNEFPHPDITAAANLTRKLGLGLMGWADLLALCHIHYDTEEAVSFGREVMTAVSGGARRASERLAKVKGPYGGYSDRTAGPCSRNETVTSIAPTGTIAVLANVWGSIEPHYALRCERTTSEGHKIQDGVPNWVWDNLDGFVPRTAHEVAPTWHIQHQAAFQEHTDLGVSKTINLPNEATVEDVSAAYMEMWERGCKGGTVFRKDCRSEQVLIEEKTKSVYLLVDGPNAVVKAQTPRLDPVERPSITHPFEVAGNKMYMTIGLFPNGLPGEVFIRTNLDGSTIEGLIGCWCRLFSVSLQQGVSLEKLIKKHKSLRFEPCGVTDNPNIPLCTSVPDYVAQFLEYRFLKKSGKEQEVGSESGMYCPDCGASALYQAGCLNCSNRACGWSRCG